MSKRSFRRLAVVAGAALAVGSMAPAMASRIDAGAGAGAGASVDPGALITDITGSVPHTLLYGPSVNLPCRRSVAAPGGRSSFCHTSAKVAISSSGSRRHPRTPRSPAALSARCQLPNRSITLRSPKRRRFH